VDERSRLRQERDRARGTVEEELKKVRDLTQSGSHSDPLTCLLDRSFLLAADGFLKADSAYLDAALRDL